MSSKVEQQIIDFENELWKEDFIQFTDRRETIKSNLCKLVEIRFFGDQSKQK